MPGELRCPSRCWHIGVTARRGAQTRPHALSLRQGLGHRAVVQRSCTPSHPILIVPSLVMAMSPFSGRAASLGAASTPEAERGFPADAMARRVLHGWERVACVGKAADGSCV